MKSFGEKIKDARINKGLTQKDLATMIGVAHNSISGWENDKNRPDPDSIELLCGVLDISPNYLLSISNDGISPSEKMMIEKYRALDPHGRQMADYVLDAEYSRVQQVIAASRGEIVENSTTIAVPLLQSVMSGESIGTISIPVSGGLDQRDLFAVKVTRDTMAPRFNPGDTIVYQQTSQVKSGDIAVVIIDGSEAICKKVIMKGDTIELVPLNPKYQSKVFSMNDVKKKRLQIMGRVVENIQAV